MAAPARQDPSALAALLSGSNGKIGSAGTGAGGPGEVDLLAKILALQRSQQGTTPPQPPNNLNLAGASDLDALKRAMLLQQQQQQQQNPNLNPLLAGALNNGGSHHQQEASLAARLEAYMAGGTSNAGATMNVQSAVAARALLEETQRHQMDASLRLALQRQQNGGGASGSAGVNAQLLAALQRQRQQQAVSAISALPVTSGGGTQGQAASVRQRTSPQQQLQHSSFSHLSEEQLLALLSAKQNQERQRTNGNT
jgi:hypothetical protein